jgi:hypothetical protein
MTPAKVTAIAIASGVALFVAGFGVGRQTSPARVEYRTLDLKTEDIIRGMTFAKKVEVTRWRNVVTTITDAGTTITDRTIEREGSSETRAETEQLKRVEYVERERVVTARPDWRVGVLAGASLREPLIPIAGPLVLGVTAERRIAGPFSCGLWINTVGAAGAVCSGEF